MRGRLPLTPLLLIGLAGCTPGGSAEPSPPIWSATPEPTATPSVTAPPNQPTVSPTPTSPVLPSAARSAKGTPAPSRSPSATPRRSPSATPSRSPRAASTTAPVAVPASTPAPQRTQTVASPEVWKDVESEATSADSVGSLVGVPESFRTYAAGLFSGPDADGCSTLYIGVMSVHPAGFVLGSVGGDCGGGQAIWANRAGVWEEAVVLQAEPLCSELSSAGVPTGVGLQCDEGGTSKIW